MAETTRLTGDRVTAGFGGLTLTLQGTYNATLTPRTANLRGSGDAAPVLKEIGLADDAQFSATVLTTDRTLLTYNGVNVTDFVLTDNTTTIYGPVECKITVTESGESAGAVTMQITAVPQAVPTQVSQLSYS